MEALEGTTKKWTEAIEINQANTRVSFKACKEQLGVLKMIRLDNFIALHSCIGQESYSPRGASMVLRERQSLILCRSCAYRIYSGLLHITRGIIS